jgi:F0F1-type ATP synthase delta subunit
MSTYPIEEGAMKDESMRVQTKKVKSLSLPLTDEQKEAIRRFWTETKSLGTVEIEVDVVGDKISPASIQVGTAK